MMPLEADMTPRDISQWLQGGWFIVELGVERTPTVCSFEMCREDGRIEVRDTGTDLHRVAQSRVFAHWPMCGAVNLDGYAVFINRQSRQQYRRTYNSRCLTVDVPRKWDVMKAAGTLTVTADSADVVNAAFNPVYYSYSDAMLKLSEGCVTVALNPHLVLAGDGDNMLVYYRCELVGKIVRNQLVPIGGDETRLRRLLKFFDGRITL